jgi:hypothetical protein
MTHTQITSKSTLFASRVNNMRSRAVYNVHQASNYLRIL